MGILTQGTGQERRVSIPLTTLDSYIGFEVWSDRAFKPYKTMSA